MRRMPRARIESAMASVTVESESQAPAASVTPVVHHVDAPVGSVEGGLVDEQREATLERPRERGGARRRGVGPGEGGGGGGERPRLRAQGGANRKRYEDQLAHRGDPLRS